MNGIAHVSYNLGCRLCRDHSPRRSTKFKSASCRVFKNDFQHKQLDLRIFFQATFGARIYTGMRIVTLDSNQMRMWYRNRPVLVDSATGEAILVDGKPRHPGKEEMLALLRAVKRKTLYDVEHEGRKCHYVNGREFLARVFIRAYNQPVQLRRPTGHVIGRAAPKFLGHDLANSDIRPIDHRPYTTVSKPVPGHLKSPTQNVANPTPTPENCPECSRYTKPIGCRDDEHHFVCRHHDAWESIRREMLERRARELRAAFEPAKPTEPVESAQTPSEDELEPEAKFKIVDLETGAHLRDATEEEVQAAQTKVDTGELPILDIGGVPYGVVDSNLAFPEPLARVVER